MCRTLSKYPVEARHAALTGKSVQNANFYAKASIFFIVGTYIGLTGLAQCQCQTAQDTPL